MFLSFCSALFSSPVSIQWLCLFLTIPLFRFNPSDVYRTTLKMIKSIWFTRQFISYQKKWRCGKFWSYPRNLIWSIFFSVANRRVMLFRCVTIHELSGDNYLFSYPYWFCNICLITENGSIIFLQHPIEFRTGECLHGTTWSVRPTYKYEIFGCEALSSYPTRHVN